MPSETEPEPAAMKRCRRRMVESGNDAGRAMRSVTRGSPGAVWACACGTGAKLRPVRRTSGSPGKGRTSLQMNRRFNILVYSQAKVAELVDALDSKSSLAHTR